MSSLVKATEMDGEIYEVWGHRFQWTSGHLSESQLWPMRFAFDTLGSDAVLRINRITPNQKTNQGMRPPKLDLYQVLIDNYQHDETLRRFWSSVNEIPSWVDWGQIERGQRVLYRYGLASINALAFQSLVGAMGPGRAAEVLARTSSLGRQGARRRILETSQFILEVMQSLASLQLGGAGHITCIRVRLLHATVRHRFMALIKKHPSHYSVEEHGIPINDLDALATILDLSVVMLVMGLPRQGIRVSEQEAEDCVAVWRLVAHYMGAPTEHLETFRSACVMLESYLLSEMRPTENSQVLAQNVFLGLENILDGYVPRPLLNANTRWLNGARVSEQLGIGTSSWWWWLVLWMVYGLLASVGYLCRFSSSFDSLHIKMQRRILWDLVVERKTASGKRWNYEFTNKPHLTPFQE